MDNNQTATQQETTVSGVFMSNLRRSSDQIKADRAATIAEGAQITYRRSIEDARLRLKNLERQRLASLDLSPNDVNSLKHAENFNAASFVDRDINLSKEIKELKETIDIATERYSYLFGETI